MRILLVYSSSEGHTAKIAGFLKEQLTASGYSVDVVNAAMECPSPATFDVAIVAAPIHAGQYPNEIVNWVSGYAADLSNMPSMFYSIGLTVTSRDPKMRESLEENTNSFLAATKWKPETVEQVAGALLYTKYGFFKKMLMKSVMKSAGGDIDTKRDFVYTDWERLSASARSFVSQFEMMEH